MMEDTKAAGQSNNSIFSAKRAGQFIAQHLNWILPIKTAGDEKRLMLYQRP